MQLKPNVIENILNIIMPVSTLFLGYYLGKRSWKKQFILESFPLHEEVLKKITAIFDDEIEGWYFKKTEQEIKQMVKNKKIMSASEYFSDMKKFGHANDVFFPNIALESIKDIMSDLDRLSTRSNKKIYKIVTEILKIYKDENKNLDFYFDNLDAIDERNILKESDNYSDYLKRETEELILLKIVPLVNNLKVELSSYLRNKE